MTLSFFVPIFNKQNSIKGTIETIHFCAKSLELEFEIIAIDDGSHDNSWQLLKELNNEFDCLTIFKNNKNIGFANTYFECVKHSKAQFGLYVSADNDILPKELMAVLEKINQAPLIVQSYSNQEIRPLTRRVISQAFTFIMNYVNNLNLNYYNGCNIFPMEFLKTYSNQEESFSFQAELLSQALKKYDHIEVSIIGTFADDNSAAFSYSNIVGTSKYISKNILRKVLS